MISADLLNSLFECSGSLFVLSHIRVVLKDKCVSGVSIPAVAYFLAWGIWNLFYYPHLGQSLSFYGALLLVIANTVYMSLLIYYRHIGNIRNSVTLTR